MRRTITGCVLILCLGVFLCPAVGKPEILTAPAKPLSCRSAQTGCAKMSEHATEQKGCASEQSQSNNCCPVPCSALILFYSPMQTLRGPPQTEQFVLASNIFASIRTDRPPVPPPRV